MKKFNELQEMIAAESPRATVYVSKADAHNVFVSVLAKGVRFSKIRSEFSLVGVADYVAGIFQVSYVDSQNKKQYVNLNMTNANYLKIAKLADKVSAHFKESKYIKSNNEIYANLLVSCNKELYSVSRVNMETKYSSINKTDGALLGAFLSSDKADELIADRRKRDIDVMTHISYSKYIMTADTIVRCLNMGMSVPSTVVGKFYAK